MEGAIETAGAAAAQPELPNLVTIAAGWLHETPLAHVLHVWENVIFSLIVVAGLSFLAWSVSRRSRLVPGRLQAAVEAVVGGTDNFICGILGPKGRAYVPFIGTLFIYILAMNMSGLVPFFKSSTSSWSTTMALALCVFCYVQYAAFKELGFVGYVDHLLGRPRGFLAYSVFIPLLMFFLHVVSEFVKPFSLSLRLRSNVWGDDMLLAVLAGFGLKGLPLLIFSMPLIIIAGVIQAVVFTLLTTIYFALVLSHEE